MKTVVSLLDQAIAVVQGSRRALSATRTPFAPAGSVARHLGHCLDVYDSFLEGLGSGRVDYTRRARDPEVESSPVLGPRAAARDRASGCGRFRRIVMEEPLFVRAEEGIPRGAVRRCSGSCSSS